MNNDRDNYNEQHQTLNSEIDLDQETILRIKNKVFFKLNLSQHLLGVSSKSHKSLRYCRSAIAMSLLFHNCKER